MASVSSGRATFIAAAVIPTGSRVKYAGNRTVTIAAAADQEIGVSGEQQVSVAVGGAVEVLLCNEPGTRFVLAGGVVADGDEVKRDAAGKVTTGAAGTVYGIALGGGIANDLIEVLPLPIDA